MNAIENDVDSATDVVCLLGDPHVVQGGRRVAVPDGCKRLLAFVALQHGRVDRRLAAGTLWPEGSDERASGNLRSAMWRLRGAGIDVMKSDKLSVFLSEHTRTDLDELCGWADRLSAGTPFDADLHVPGWTTSVTELLPGWYDEWVIFERERIRQRMLHALEILSRLLRAAGRFDEAVEVAMDAVAVEPLRESAQRVLAEAHVAEGNYVEAQRTFLQYRDLVRRELGVEPSMAFATWLRSTMPRGQATNSGRGPAANGRPSASSLGRAPAPVRLARPPAAVVARASAGRP